MELAIYGTTTCTAVLQQNGNVSVHEIALLRGTTLHLWLDLRLDLRLHFWGTVSDRAIPANCLILISNPTSLPLHFLLGETLNPQDGESLQR